MTKRDSSAKSRDWRGTREFNRRKDALQKIIDTPNAEPKDVFRAMEMLDAHIGIPDLKAENERLTGEVARLTKEVATRDTQRAELVAEVARLTTELAETNATLTEANDWIETHQVKQ